MNNSENGGVWVWVIAVIVIGTIAYWVFGGDSQGPTVEVGGFVDENFGQLPEDITQ